MTMHPFYQLSLLYSAWDQAVVKYLASNAHLEDADPKEFKKNRRILEGTDGLRMLGYVGNPALKGPLLQSDIVDVLIEDRPKSDPAVHAIRQSVASRGKALAFFGLVVRTQRSATSVEYSMTDAGRDVINAFETYYQASLSVEEKAEEPAPCVS